MDHLATLIMPLAAIAEGPKPPAAVQEEPWHHLDRGFLPQTPPSEKLSHTLAGSVAIPDTLISLDEEPTVAVIGVGYVGAHLVDAFSSKFNVIGYDVSEGRVGELSAQTKIPNRVRFTTNTSTLVEATHFLVSVPTLLQPDKSVDTSCLRDALKMIGKHARAGATVIIESSVAVGMTRDLLGPLAASRGFFAGMSPERVDPGRTSPATTAIPKVISGLDDVVPGSLAAVARLYAAVFEHVVAVSSPETAEMTKLYENCQRMVCIAFANEMADACGPLAVDPHEVAAAAASKPFGYLPVAPGLGVGGHCIPVNPHYLMSTANFPLLRQATDRMSRRPAEMAQRILRRVCAPGGAKREGAHRPRVLVVGVAFKAGQSNLSHSPGLALATQLDMSGKVEVAWADALVRQEAIPQIARLGEDDWRKEKLEMFDTIVVSFRQHEMDFRLLHDLRGVRVEMWCR